MIGTDLVVEHLVGRADVDGSFWVLRGGGTAVGLFTVSAYAYRAAELLDRHGLVDVPDAVNTWPPPSTPARPGPTRTP